MRRIRIPARQQHHRLDPRFLRRQTGQHGVVQQMRRKRRYVENTLYADHRVGQITKIIKVSDEDLSAYFRKGP
ncbi:hypothetical protein GCM10007879_19090 [Maritalea porphyrae]|uniref:Uncharacterized protein n=1 Tax=Maritalea porphyrae TaxID=880732 RepID=A0ABQ5UTK8_9HYPH|nr:hypothetical protein GCM10007879_19090 [Maritalea porphyrae]